MKTSIAFLFLIIAVIAVSALFRSGDKSAVHPIEGLPWQIEILPNGETRVFGLIPARSTLDDARGRFGMDMEIAVIAAPGEPGSLEAYSSSVTTGVIMGKMILVADVDRETVARLRQRAVKAEYMDGSHPEIYSASRRPGARLAYADRGHYLHSCCQPR